MRFAYTLYFRLTVISYGWVTGSSGGEDDAKRKFYTSTNNGRLLGPICLVTSIVMFIMTAVLRTLSTNARFRQTRVGFHCPVHGDFFPISPGPDPRKFSCESMITLIIMTQHLPMQRRTVCIIFFRRLYRSFCKAY